jgi:hypothetical protein
MKAKSKNAERIYLFVGTKWVGAAIWGSMASIFLFDASSRERFCLLCLYDPDLYEPLRSEAAANALRLNGDCIVDSRIVR